MTERGRFKKYSEAVHIQLVVMGRTITPAIFKPEKNLVFFQDKIAGAIDDRPVSLSD